VALVTGASSGIGRATAEAMARQGARVGVNYCKNQDGAKQAAETIRKADSLAKELAPHGIRVNGIAPGVIATPFHERHTSAEIMQRLVPLIPLGRAGTAEEIADVIVFLASPAARYITGETLEVNGGMLMD
jgi:3-oxoacyl-[acyl-carrier protein] reductase